VNVNRAKNPYSGHFPSKAAGQGEFEIQIENSANGLSVKVVPPATARGLLVRQQRAVASARSVRERAE
jgi:hypothetical protein